MELICTIFFPGNRLVGNMYFSYDSKHDELYILSYTMKPINMESERELIYLLIFSIIPIGIILLFLHLCSFMGLKIL